MTTTLLVDMLELEDSLFGHELEHIPIDVEGIKRRAGPKFNLQDEANGGHSVQTYRLNSACYVTLVWAMTDGKSCMQPLDKDVIATQQTPTIQEAAQLHADAVNYLNTLYPKP